MFCMKPTLDLMHAVNGIKYKKIMNKNAWKWKSICENAVHFTDITDVISKMQNATNHERDQPCWLNHDGYEFFLFFFDMQI